MTIRRRLALTILLVVGLLVVFAFFQTWVYSRIERVNQSLVSLNKMTDQIEQIKEAQTNYLRLNARRYIGAIDATMRSLKEEFQFLKGLNLREESKVSLDDVEMFFSEYEVGLKTFISVNDQYHALMAKREQKILELVIQVQTVTSGAPREILSLTLGLVNRKDTDLRDSDPAFAALKALGTEMMNTGENFELKLHGRRVAVLVADIQEIINHVDEINLENQSQLFFIDEKLNALDDHLSKVRMSKRAFSSEILMNLQIFYWVVTFVAIVVFVIIIIKLSQRIGTSINNLVEGTERIAGGDYNEVVTIEGKDELSDLAIHINKMAESLRMSNLSIKTYSNQLEHLVKVKTYELTKANESLEDLNRKLAIEKERFAKLALTDILTEINNRAYFMDALTQKIDESKRYGKSFSICLLDIDHFKSVNDQHGHMVGDMVLKQFSKLLKRETRTSDIVARYGGEEFVIIYTEAALSSALQISERIRVAVSTENFEIEGLKVTISAGVADYKGESEGVFLKRVDDLLYTAKREGRNRIASG